MKTRWEEIKKRIEKNTTELNKLEGEYEASMKSLSSEFGVSSIEEGEHLLKKEKKKLETLVNQMNEDMDELEGILDNENEV